MFNEKMIPLISKMRKAKSSTAFVVALSIFTDMIVYGIIIPILPDILDSVGRNSDEAGFLLGSFAVGLFVFTPIFGVISDRYKTRKLPMLFGLLALASSTLLFALAQSYAVLIFARLAQGISSGATWTIGLAMIADIYPSDKVGVVMGSIMGANTLGFLLGPLIGGYLFKNVSRGAPFYFCAILALLDFFGRLFIIPVPLEDCSSPLLSEEHVNIENGEEAGDAVKNEEMPKKKNNLFTLKPTASLISVLVAICVVTACYSAMEPTLSVHLHNTFLIDEDTVGLMFTALAIPSVFVSSLFGWLGSKIGNKLTYGIGMLLMAINLPLIAVPGSIALEVVALVFLGITSSMALVPQMPDLMEIANEDGDRPYAQLYAIFNMAYSVGMIGGSFLGAAILKYSSFFWLMTFFGIFMLIFSIFFIGYGIKINRRKLNEHTSEEEPLIQ
jgi:DHA1 family solute carrier family 18 vesicular amine transporter 1/2